MHRSTPLRLLSLLALTAALLTSAACGDDERGGDDDNNAAANNNPANNNPANNNPANNNPANNNPANNNPVNNNPVNNNPVNNNPVNNNPANNNPVNNNPPDPVAQCVEVCGTISACQELSDACGAELTAVLKTSCETACAQDEDARQQILAVGALDCATAVPLAIGGFDVAQECSPACGAYCDALGANCTGDNAQYDSDAACRVACAGFDDSGMDGDTSGDTLQCRTYHAGDPAAADPATHCAHAGVDGGGVCAPPEPTRCDAYCDLALANCTGGNLLYTNRAECQAACAEITALGEEGDTSGDTLECRIYHLGDPASADPATHCPHGGPDGGGVCADPPPAPCEVYCDNVLTHCTGADALYADEAECMAACALIPATGQEGDTSGNTLQCRTYHAGDPAAADPSLHCPHASLSGGDVCGTWCEVYCELTETTCTGDNALYADRSACLAACDELPQDAPHTAVEGDSVQCRIYHGGLPARMDAALHCAHAAEDGGGVCADAPPTPCEDYCGAVLTACTGEDAVYGDEAECLAACVAFGVDGMDGDATGDTLQCRATAAAAGRCADASPTGGDACVSAELTPGAGDLVITEFMKNPAAVDDNLGEWIEVYNASGRVLELEGLRLEDANPTGGDGHTLATPGGSWRLAPGAYAVLGNNADPDTNGGVAVDYAYASFTLANGNSGDTITLLSGEVVVDTVVYNNTDFPNLAGVAAQLSGDFDLTGDNNAGAAWCNAPGLVSADRFAGDQGSPGRPNVACSPTEGRAFTIPQLRRVDDPAHPAIGSEVQVTGAVVVAISANGANVFLQTSAGGPWSGIFVDASGVDTTGLMVGAEVSVVGHYVESFRTAEGESLSTIWASVLTVTGTATVPNPQNGTAEEFGAGARAEPWESTLVRVEDVVVTQEANNFNEFQVDGALLVDDLLYLIDPLPAADTAFTFLTGVLNYSFGDYKLLPRAEADVLLDDGSGEAMLHEVTIMNFAMSPDPITVRVGDTVRWTNLDGAVHTVTSGNPSDPDAGSLFDSGSLGQGQTFEHTFTEVGTFNYFCRPHSGSMSGYTVTVE